MFTKKKKILIALVPVIHIKYLELFQKYPEHLYILSDDILKQWNKFKNLKRDLRTINQEKIWDLLKKTDLLKKVDLLTPANIKDVKSLATETQIVMPDEDVSRWVADKFFPKQKIKFENIFLRWNKPVSTQELEVSPDRIISTRTLDKKLIKATEKLKEKSANWWRQIGALVTDENNKILLTSFNRHVPTQENIAVYGDLRSCFDAGENHELSNSIHAEASLIGIAAREGISLKNKKMFVTTFPCPTCAKLIVEAGIKKVYYKEGYSLSDAEDILNGADIEIVLVK